MKAFVNGDTWCITEDDFVHILTDPYVLFPLNSWMGKRLSKDGIDGLTEGECEVMQRTLDGTVATNLPSPEISDLRHKELLKKSLEANKDIWEALSQI